ncbi:MAG TPA: DUF6463 family protein [Thermoanaerobaculia bacterium]|nr:DUF6463 family protein [Thermoanaerobaculia bacterium]
MKRWVGRWIIGVGIIHVAFGFVAFRAPLLAILRDGVWNAVDGHSGRPLAFWFVFLGLFTIVFGSLVDWIESRGLSTPRFVGWAFLILVVLGIVTMPGGGGWLLLPGGVGLFLRSYRRATGLEAAV